MLLRVQTTPKLSLNTNRESITIAFTNPPQVGNAIVIPMTTWSGDLLPCTVKDSDGQFGEVAVYHSSPGDNKTSSAIYYISRLAKVTAPYSVTLTLPRNSPYSVLCAMEVSGAGAYGLVVETTAKLGSTVADTAPHVGPSPISAAAELFVVAVVGSSREQTFITVEAAPTGWAQEFEELPWTNATGEADSRALSAQTGLGQSCSWTFGTVRHWATVLAAFRVATSAAQGRVTQDAIELLNRPSSPILRVTQDAVELLSLPSAVLRISQYAIETLVLVTADARLTQYAVETLTSLMIPVPPEPQPGGGGETSHPFFS